MTKPYSIDLREPAVAGVLGGESVRSVAAVAGISASTNSWLFFAVTPTSPTL